MKVSRAVRKVKRSYVAISRMDIFNTARVAGEC